MKPSDRAGPFLSVAPHCALKRLEAPSLYDICNDELYELDDEAFAFLASSPSLAEARRDSAAAALAATCLEDGICMATEERVPRPPAGEPLLPSLRYLLVHITSRCNLRCRHCFLGEPAARELALDDLLQAAGEFDRLQGLRFIVSGGEPLLHPHFRDLNDRLPDYAFRAVLLTNGTLVDKKIARSLRFHEIQVSVDGLEDSHDLIRGAGSYHKALRGLRHLADAGLDLSVATMVHRANLRQFDALREVLSEFPLRSWSVDVPCLSGNLESNRPLVAEAGEAARTMRHSFGGGYYGTSGEYACGAHLAAVMSDGSICKCGHFAGRPEGRLREGLAAVWKRMRRLRLAELDCRCSQIESCRGGCRYRAALFSCLYSADPIQCLQRGIPVGGDLKDPEPA